MADDYSAAATRHFRDASLLEREGRQANADHLFGFAAECAIKEALLSCPGAAVGGRLGEAYYKHINELWLAAQLQSIHRRHPQLVKVLKQLQQPFADWSVYQRYGHDSVVTEDAMRRHRTAAKRVLGSVGLLGSLAER